MVASLKKTRRIQSLILTKANTAYRKNLNAYALSRCNDKNNAEDMVQKTFMKTWLYLVKGGKIELMKAFLYHVLSDLIIDEYRKRKTVSLDALCKNGFEPKLNTKGTKHFLDSLDGKEAMLLIQRLPKKYRKVMSMRYLEGLSISEMAAINKESKNNISVQINRGLKKLRLLIKFKK